jgi:hypothetical protein
MFFAGSRQRALNVLGQLGARACMYNRRGTVDAWQKTLCDCKFTDEGGQLGAAASPESTACPELRALYGVITAMTDEEWAVYAQRAGGVV